MPKRKPFVCQHCKRSFSMAAHLARHSRVHAQNRSKSTPKRATELHRAGTAPNTQFATLVAGLRDGHRSLTAERDALDTQIAALESALAAIGSGGASRNGKRAVHASSDYRPGSLKDRIQRVLTATRTPMPVSEVAAAVVRSGFKSKNKTLSTTVGIALAEMAGVRRVRRGVYGLR